MATKEPAQEIDSARLSQADMGELLAAARKERQRCEDYGGDKTGALLSLLMIDLLQELKELSTLAREALARAGSR